MKSRLLILGALLCLVRSASADPLADLVADPQRWPTEVTVPAATKGTVIVNGQPAGMMLIGAGKKITVSEITADSVTGKLGGTTVRVPLAKTNVATFAAAAAPAAPPVVAAAAVPAPAPQPAAHATPPGVTTPLQRMFGSSLVRFSGEGLQDVGASALNGVKYYALYYSASWCGPCRQFTPSLVTAYRELKPAHPEFELIFVSDDHSAGDMADYMKMDAMPWLAVKFNSRNQKMVDYSGPGIPCLVLVDANGNVLSDSFQGDNYLGPHHVLADTRRILAQGR
jgi:nucleoredoxin